MRGVWTLCLLSLVRAQLYCFTLQHGTAALRTYEIVNVNPEVGEDPILLGEAATSVDEIFPVGAISPSKLLYWADQYESQVNIFDTKSGKALPPIVLDPGTGITFVDVDHQTHTIWLALMYTRQSGHPSTDYSFGWARWAEGLPGSYEEFNGLSNITLPLTYVAAAGYGKFYLLAVDGVNQTQWPILWSFVADSSVATLVRVACAGGGSAVSLAVHSKTELRAIWQAPDGQYLFASINPLTGACTATNFSTFTPSELLTHSPAGEEWYDGAVFPTTRGSHWQPGLQTFNFGDENASTTVDLVPGEPLFSCSYLK